jgi:pimeloyl-ACP methyl ester carboxylesterase
MTAHATSRVVLVHGAWHGAWCWERVAAHLRDAGHEVLAVDLPGHGSRSGEAASMAAYRDAVMDVLTQSTVLVGHSMGGAVISAVADAAPEQLRHLVYVTAFAPRDGESLLDAAAGRLDFASAGLVVNDDFDIIVPDEAAAAGLFYGDCPRADVAWAFAQLQPQAGSVFAEPITLSHFDDRVPRSYLLCTADAAIPPDLQLQYAARLGVVPTEISSAHSPFLSQPAAVAGYIASVC